MIHSMPENGTCISLFVTLVGLDASAAASLWVIPDHCRWCDRDDSGHDTASGLFTEAIALVVALARSCALDDCGHQEVLWLAGLPLAATTGWLRIAGDQHYAIDVLAGAGVGVAAGLIIPELHRRRQRTHVSAAPTLHGGRVAAWPKVQ